MRGVRPSSEPIAQFIQRKGRINECASRFARAVLCSPDRYSRYTVKFMKALRKYGRTHPPTITQPVVSSHDPWRSQILLGIENLMTT
jgi:hypothetical protein